MDAGEEAMLVAATMAMIGSVAAIGMAALQTLANPSGTVVASVPLIVASGVLGMAGTAAFGLLWLLRNIKSGR